MSFSKSIDNMQKSFKKYIDSYLELNDPTITPSFLTDINEALASLNNESRRLNADLDKINKNLDLLFDKDVLEYSEKSNQNLIESEAKKVEIKNLHETKIKNINLEVEKAEIQNEKDINNAEMEIDLYYSVSNQNVQMFEDEFEDSKTRLEYQYSKAKESYNNSIVTNNDIMEKNLAVIKHDYLHKLDTYDEDTNNVLKIYDADIEETKKQIALKEAEYNKKIEDIKEQKRDESTKLNTIIRSYFIERGDEIEKSREKSSESHNEADQEREKRKQSYNHESQRISKEFVSKINVLDEDEDKLKNNFDDEMLEHNQMRNYDMLKIHKRHENELVSIYNSNLSNFQSRLRVKRTNNFYHHVKAQSNRSHDKLMNEIKKQYSSDIEKNSYQKRLLDINRSTSFKRLTEQEIRDNKYFQEIENLYEATLNFEIFKANQECNKRSNDAKLESSIRNVYFEGQTDEIDAIYQKEIEKLNAEIKKKNLEIGITKELNKIVHDFENEKYNRGVSYHTVSNLLTIERYKLLDQYNKNQFDLNLESASTSLEYSKEKMNIKNKKFEDVTHKDVVIAKKKLENFKEYSRYMSIVQGINTDKEISIVNRNYIHNNDIYAYHIFIKRYNLEVKKIENILSTFIIISRKIEDTSFKVVHKLIDDIDNASDLKLYIKFMNGLIGEFFKFYRSIIENFKELIINLIDERLSFEEEFKYKKLFDEYKSDYTKKINLQKSEKQQTEKRIIKLENEIDDYNKEIYNLEYAIEYKKRGGASRKEIMALQATNQQKINSIKVEMNKTNEELKILNDSLYLIDQEISSIEANYNEALTGTKQTQLNSAYPFHKFKLDFSKLMNKFIVSFGQNLGGKTTEDKQTIKLMNYKIEKLVAYYIDQTNTEIYNAINKFKDSSKKNNEASYNRLVNIYEKDIDKINTSTLNLLMSEKDKYDKICLKINRELDLLNDERKNLENHYEVVNKNNEEKFQKNNNAILTKKKEIMEDFYKGLYALNANKEDIENDYQNFITTSFEQFQNDKRNTIERNVEESKKIDADLELFINSRNEVLKHLPIAIREQIRELQEENKLRNLNLDESVAKQKNQFNVKTRDIKRQILSIDAIYDANIVKIDIEEKTLKNKERKNLVQTLAKI
ncbi:MAG: hypothetical protein IJU60_05250 [Acholeplasmatales bacterium]|nr:hypothetical protein [Acholeplasmatales bacterium]